MKNIGKSLLLTLLFSTGIQADKLGDLRALLTHPTALEDGTIEESLAIALGLDTTFRREFHIEIRDLGEEHLSGLYRLPEGFKTADVLLQYNRLHLCYSKGCGSKKLTATQKAKALRANELLYDLLIEMALPDEDEGEETARKSEGIRVPA